MADVTETELLREAIDDRIAQVHTMIPGTVISVDAAAMTATVQPGIKVRVPTRDGESIYEALPAIHNVPLAFPQGGDTFMRWTVLAGDTVELRFCEVDAGGFQNSGATSEPGDDTRHGLNSAIATPCFVGPNGGAMPTGNTLVVEADEIKLGAAAVEFVARADRTDADLGLILSLLQTWTVSPSDGGAALKTAAASVTLSGTACDKVKGE